MGMACACPVDCRDAVKEHTRLACKPSEEAARDQILIPRYVRAPRKVAPWGCQIMLDKSRRANRGRFA
jgi:hypothetical protein